MRPDDLNVKILGIVGTPIKDGNCQYFLERALQAAESVGRVTTELIHLRDYRIEYCAGCESCLRRVHKIQKQVGLDVIPVPVKGYNCSIKDDMEIIHKKMLEADGILLAAPVYIATIPGQMKTFIDRCRTFVHDLRLREKVAAPLTVAFFRNAGSDTALQAMALSLLAMGLNVVSFGASAVSTKEGLGIPIRDTRFAVKEDLIGMTLMSMAATQVARSALQMKAGRIAMEKAGILAKTGGWGPVTGD
ncbi:MAG: flavodoxin family protein [Deltaproteobacteria bacterium]|nr:flavodoxin family protein [Deltaproteobacteria bacterium]